MRTGWEDKLLKDICSVFGRIGFRGYTKADFVSTPDNGAITLSPSNIIGGELSCDKCSYVSWEKYYQSPEIMVFPGDILLVKTASIGKCALVRSLPHEATINPQFVLLKEIKVNHQYLTYFLQSPIAQKKFQEFAIGAAVPTFSQKKLEGLIVPTPSLPEQQRIVDILDREFAKIDALKANTEKSLQAAKDLFQATTDTMMSNGQWRELTIGEIAKIKGGKRVPKGYKLEKEPTAHRYIRVADFTDLGTIRTESVLYISDEVYKSIKAYTISSKDVYISIAGTIGKSGIIPDTLDGANLTENACKLVLGPNFYNRFVFFATKTSSFKKQVETLTMQAAQPKLALTRLATIRVRVPSSIKEQETIVERLDGIADTIALLQDNYQKTLTLCDDLKQSLLRKAFNGEL